MTAIRIEYKGVNPRGIHSVGVEPIDDLARWTREKYDRGWKSLTVFRGGHPVAWIARNPDTGERIWCCE